MRNEISCDIIRDLLPSYVDGLTSDASNQAIEAHLSGCKACSEALSSMRAPVPVEKEDIPEVNYLKKIKRSRQRLVICAAALAVMLLTILTILLPTFFVRKARIDELQWAVLGTGVMEDGSRYVEVRLDNTLSRYDIAWVESQLDEQDDMHVEVYLRGLPLFSHPHFDSDSVPLMYTETTDRILLCDDYLIWENGSEIQKPASLLYALSQKADETDYPEQITSYLGADVLTWDDKSDPLTVTAGEKKWTLNLAGEPTHTIAHDSMEKTIRRISCLLLATTPRLEAVSWTYTENGVPHAIDYTRADADREAGGDAASFRESAAQLQTLIERIDFETYLFNIPWF